MVIGAAMLLAGQSSTQSVSGTSSSAAAAAASLVGSLGGIPKSPSFHSGLELAAAAKDHLKAYAQQQQLQTQQPQPSLVRSPNSSSTIGSNGGFVPTYPFAMPSTSSSSSSDAAKVRIAEPVRQCVQAVTQDTPPPLPTTFISAVERWRAGRQRAAAALQQEQSLSDGPAQWHSLRFCGRWQRAKDVAVAAIVVDGRADRQSGTVPRSQRVRSDAGQCGRNAAIAERLFVWVCVCAVQ